MELITLYAGEYVGSFMFEVNLKQLSEQIEQCAQAERDSFIISFFLLRISCIRSIAAVSVIMLFIKFFSTPSLTKTFCENIHFTCLFFI